MAFRLVAYIDGRPRRFVLNEGEAVLGSHRDCDIMLREPTVSRRHARLVIDESSVTIEDLHSRNGLRLGAKKIETAVLEAGSRFLIGAVPAVIESIEADDLEAGMIIDQDPEDESQGTTEPSLGETTFGSGPLESFVANHAPRILQRIRLGADPTLAAQLIGEALFECLNCTELCIGAAEAESVLFTATREVSETSQCDPLAVEVSGRRFEVRMLHKRAIGPTVPLLELAAEMLALAGLQKDDQAEPRSPGATPPRPDPPTVVPRMRGIYDDAVRVAQGEVPVLILGESGTGKEVLARFIHQASPRSEGAFLGLNCASLPEDLLESELFGIEKGVATGVDARPGKFEQANGGILFLDEIGDMALGTQAKILRVLQSGESYRLGARDPREVDVRIVAATNQDIDEMVREGSFRTDLYHRVATWVVELPPLRRRRADIPNLAAFFLAREAAKQGIRVAGISRAAIKALSSFHWPGNVRQLENEMSRAVLFLENGDLLETGSLSDEVRGAPRSGGSSLSEILESVERDEIIRTLSAVDGQIESAAKQLGISRATLYRRMKALDID